MKEDAPLSPSAFETIRQVAESEELTAEALLEDILQSFSIFKEDDLAIQTEVFRIPQLPGKGIKLYGVLHEDGRITADLVVGEIEDAKDLCPTMDAVKSGVVTMMLDVQKDLFQFEYDGTGTIISSYDKYAVKAPATADERKIAIELLASMHEAFGV